MTDRIKALFSKTGLMGSLICLLLMSSVFVYVCLFGVNVLYTDEWTWVSLVKEIQAHGISFNLLIKPHNEHCIFFPKLLYALTYEWTKMNSKVYMYFNACMLCVVFICLYAVARKQFSFHFGTIPLWFLIVPLLVFNFRQSNNLVWGFQITFYIVLAFSILGLFLSEKACTATTTNTKVGGYFFLAVVCATAASFSSAMGITTWISASVIYLLGPNRKKLLIAWLMLGLLTYLTNSYFTNIHPQHDSVYALTHPFGFLHFYFSLISLASFWPFQNVAFLTGLALSAVSVFVLIGLFRNNQLQENKFWMALYLFGFLIALQISVARFPLSFSYTEKPRYTIFTGLLIVSTFIMFYALYIRSNKKLERKLFHLFFASLIIFGCFLEFHGLQEGIILKHERTAYRSTVLNYKIVSDNDIYSMCRWCDSTFVKTVRDDVPFLQSHGYSSFSESKK